jgi:hydroxyethylthiazole kinase-like uncharacterized protein yjeF
MKNLFFEVNTLDKRCYEKFYLSEDILMENAANALCQEIRVHAVQNAKVLFICGAGNNGADGIAAARRLFGELDVSIYLPHGVKSNMAKLQLERAKSLHVKMEEEIKTADIYVDCIFGSGLNKELDTKTVQIIEELNEAQGIKIACDIPTGIDSVGYIKQVAFRADVTITMGALKEALYSDNAKDFTGEIKVGNLGISQKNYEKPSQTFLLEDSDMRLPYRNKKDTHKGSFGHVAILGGEKEGASILAATAALNFGAGLVSVVSKKDILLPPYLMKSEGVASHFSVVVAGMGLGKIDDVFLYDSLLAHAKPLVLDADIFYDDIIIKILKEKEDVVLTPHPKEFCSLLKILGLGDIDVAEVQKERLKWVKEFSQRYPKIVLLLKGANTIITHNKTYYINSQGSQRLAKGGSGDVLAGMIGSLIAQGYSILDATISASLAHAKAANNIQYADYALNPIDICEGIRWL